MAGLALAVAATGATAESDRTRLIELRAGSALSDFVRGHQSLGFELSDGRSLTFGDWYRSALPDTHVSFLTPLTPNLGVTWGLGTGESGGQYRIDPSLKLGIVAVRDLRRGETLTFSARGILGGRLSERPCTAGYGAIGGERLVNCLLAATAMRPGETLEYLFDTPPPDRLSMSLRYRFEF